MSFVTATRNERKATHWTCAARGRSNRMRLVTFVLFRLGYVHEFILRVYRKNTFVRVVYVLGFSSRVDHNFTITTYNLVNDITDVCLRTWTLVRGTEFVRYAFLLLNNRCANARIIIHYDIVVTCQFSELCFRRERARDGVGKRNKNFAHSMIHETGELLY